MLVQFATQRPGDALIARHVDAMRTMMQACLERVGPLGAKPEFRIIEGNAHFLIREQIAAFDPDLIAVGSHARSAAATAILGSFARGLLADSDCDILIAPPIAADRHLKLRGRRRCFAICDH